VINAIKHGNRLAPDKPVDVRFTLEPSTLNVFVRDHGEGFDPDQVPNPLDPDNLLNPNGRGIFYMRTFMDEVEYSFHPDGGTIVRMSKRRRENDNKGDTVGDGTLDD
jgi:serine/threonine-protein kinase RsbW